jgi:hypothetical protein
VTLFCFRMLLEFGVVILGVNLRGSLHQSLSLEGRHNTIAANSRSTAPRHVG